MKNRYVSAMISTSPITERKGMFSFMLQPCTASILANILDPDVPFVWIRHHTPKRTIAWWKTQACLSEKGQLYDVEVRWMDFDLQLSTARFLELLPEFEEHGLVLFQMTRRVPNSLILDGKADDVINHILIQNGLHVAFYLPHAVECAQLASPRREVLERALQQEKVKELAYGAA
jgi:hypothetical protein